MLYKGQVGLPVTARGQSQNRPGEKLVGFDAREMFIPARKAWSARRRLTFLLREDVGKPLSVDPLVWPSIFGDGLPEDVRKRLHLESVPIPPWRGPTGNLWSDLAALRVALAGFTISPYLVVAVTRHDAGIAVATVDETGAESAVPAARPMDWTLLGYDIADSGLISGLSNCGYKSAERARLGSRWASRLNSHHLFDDLESAFSFRTLTDKRVPEHQPFFVYGIWQIDD